jgi:DNA-binding transcriptional LysR family regulator
LEEELRCELFRKRGRGIELTPDGERLLEKSKAILSSIDTLKSDMKREPESLSGRYRLGASHFLTSRLLFQGWNELQKKHPRLVADLHSMNTVHAIAEVLSGRLDLAVCIGPLKHPALSEFVLLRGDLVVVVRKDHPILKKTQRDQIRFLGEQTAVIHKSSQGVDICETHPVFDRLGFQPKIDLYFDSDDTAVECLLASDRWSFLPDLVAQAHEDKLAVIRLPRAAGTAPYHVSALIHRERGSDKALQALTQSLKNCCPA